MTKKFTTKQLALMEKLKARKGKGNTDWVKELPDAPDAPKGEKKYAQIISKKGK